ncbi:MAG TPA: tol-pal system protein YbgF [Steroidobacteraceae bacterium]
MRLTLVVGMACVLTGCAVAPEEDPVQIKLNEIDGRVARIERANQGVVEIAQRMETMQAELRQLRGRIEELENSTEALRKQQRDLYSDLDRRISAASAIGPSGAGGAGAGTAAGEQAAYTQAFDALKAANYPAAITGFQQFLQNYPDSDLADNAQYWLGEVYYVTRDYPNALAAFRAVGERWPDSRKAADALVKLGFTQAEMKQVAQARETLNQVIQRFPDTEAARLAAERLKRLPQR